ncbi:MAG: LytR/AlgR family response regulator transcription factor [Thermoleophilia bacterium]
MRGEMILRALVVDDEPRARSHLRDLLGEIEGVELVGEASTAAEAEKLLLAVEHDLVFLDIRMPGMDGMSAAEIFVSLPKAPFVVFTTAYDEYAARAFELGAADYLLKPVSKARLLKAVIRARELKAGGELVGTPAVRSAAPDGEGGHDEGATTKRMEYVTARKDGRMVLVRIEEIAYLSVDGETVHVATGDETLVAMAPSMDQLEQSLAGSDFFRAHRSFLVNLRKVAEVVPLNNRTYELVMKDRRGSRVPVSRRKAVELRDMLGF